VPGLCTPECRREPGCGDGRLDPGEACDDGTNNGPGKRCSIACVITPVCGDNHKDGTEACDDGNLVAGDIDRDGDVDLIWVAAEQRSAVIWLNQGEGEFVEARDNQPYSSELDELFTAGDSPDKRLVKKRSKSSSLVSSSFSDIGAALEIEFQAPIVARPTFATVERPADRLAFLTKLQKRGPPSILS
jgi:hypothetical protein